jgi:DNA-binding NarL/FixJ family response regulator
LAKVASGSGLNGHAYNKARIILADDHPLLRHALNDILTKDDTFDVIAEASDGEEAVKLATQLIPDIVIMDISMPKLNGLLATKQIKAKCPNIAILVLTVHSDNEHILGILQAGADGYLLKSVHSDEVIQAVHTLIAGDTVFSPAVSREIIKYASQYMSTPVGVQTGERISAREMEILKLAARGMSNKAIAHKLDVSQRTVKGHLGELFLKLGAGSRTEAIAISLRLGILKPGDLEP